MSSSSRIALRWFVLMVYAGLSVAGVLLHRTPACNRCAPSTRHDDAGCEYCAGSDRPSPPSVRKGGFCPVCDFLAHWQAAVQVFTELSSVRILPLHCTVETVSCYRAPRIPRCRSPPRFNDAAHIAVMDC